MVYATPKSSFDFVTYFETRFTSSSAFSIATVAPKSIDNASEAGHKLSNGTSGNILPATALQRNWHDYKYVRPVPATAIQENPNLSQNPGWEKVYKK